MQKKVWISETTWILVNERVSERRDPARDQSLIRRLGHAIATSLKVDYRRRVEESGEEVERLLWSYPLLHQEAWHRMKGWYQAVVNRVLPPSRFTLERITE